jgi:transposase
MRLDGSVTAKRHFRTSEAELINAFKDLPGELHVHMEAGELAPWIREVIKPFVKSVIISHARDNAWIAKDPNKGDKVDAFKLADLRRMNRVHPVHYAEQRSRRDFKQLVQHYDDLTGQEVRLKLKIKARLRTQGVIIHNSSLFSEKGFPKVLAQVPSAEMRSAITQLYKGLVYTYELWDDARELMLTASKSFPEVQLFQAVPGIGPIGAARFSAYVQTPHRFSNKRKLWRYCRLGICQRSSDGKKLSHPRLDKAGCGRLKDVARKAFEAAIRAKKDNQFKRAYERALQSTHDKTHARLTVMRKIISVLRAMWLTNTAYQDQLGQ